MSAENSILQSEIQSVFRKAGAGFQVRYMSEQIDGSQSGAVAPFESD